MVHGVASYFFRVFVLYHRTEVNLIPEYSEGFVEHHVDAFERSWKTTCLTGMGVGVLAVETEAASCEGISGITPWYSELGPTYHSP